MINKYIEKREKRNMHCAIYYNNKAIDKNFYSYFVHYMYALYVTLLYNPLFLIEQYRNYECNHVDIYFSDFII